MLLTTLRTVGGSVMFAIPKPILEGLGLSAKTISALLHADPSLADWWIRMEEESQPASPLAGFFRKDRPSYRRLRDAVLAEKAMDFGERDELAECFCHD
jgi:hypothetical protein